MAQFSCSMIEGLLMQFDAEFVVSVIGLMLTLIGQTWLVITFLLNRADVDKRELIERMDADSRDILKKVSELHEKVNSVKDDYVRKDDADKEITRLYRNMTDYKIDLVGQINTINARLDTIINSLGGVRKVT